MAIDYPSRYIQETPPQKVEELPAYLDRELRRISTAIEILASGYLEKTFVEPDKKAEGMLRYADGTDWNPGSGAGVYQFRGSSWVFIG